jgi:hypothetical protein
MDIINVTSQKKNINDLICLNVEITLICTYTVIATSLSGSKWKNIEAETKEASGK